MNEFVIPGQFGPFLPPVPWQLPALLLGIGFLLMAVGLAQSVGPRAVAGWRQLYRGERGLLIGLVALGVLAGAASAFWSRRLLWYYALLLTVAGRTIEGALITRFVAKLLNFLSGSGGGLAAKVVSKLRDRAARIVFTGLISTALVFTVVVAFIREPQTEAIVWTAFAYTIARVGIISITVIYQLKDVVDRFNQLGLTSGYSITTGLVIAIAGAEIFDLPPFLGLVTIPTTILQSPTGLIAVRFGGFIGLLAGVVISWSMLARKLAKAER